MKKRNNQQGAAIIIYLLIMAVVVTVLMIGTYSRLLLALKRGQSTTDALLINYVAESEINDWIARLSEGYIKMSPFSIHIPKTIGNTTLTIDGSQTGNTQTIVVQADRPYASTKITADRTVESLGKTSAADIILSLDCTGSMKSKADPGSTTNPNQTRMDALKASALNFVQTLEKNPNPNIKIGIDIFGTGITWLTTDTNAEIRPNNVVALSEIETAIRHGFGYVNGLELTQGATRENSPACLRVADATSVGTAFVFPQDYYAINKKPGVKQIEIVITDGEPNSRTNYPACQPDRSCNFCDAAGIDFLSCAVSDKNTSLPAYDIYPAGARKGVRDPSISAYAVTISTSPNGQASQILTDQLGSQYYPIQKASSLTSILSTILTNILSSRETITIHKDIPGS